VTSANAPDLSALIKAYDVRGVVPDPFSPQVARAIGAAFADVVVLRADAEAGAGRPRAVIGRDMRPSGPELVAAFAEGLTSRGVDVVTIGLCSTDGLYHASGALGVPGAMFTASHNPAQYNGIKMCWAGARPVGEDSGLGEIRSLAARYLVEPPAPAAEPGTVAEREMLAEYAGFLRSLVDLRGSRPLKVVVDAGNGMGGLTVPAVLGEAAGLEALPFDVVPLYFELDGTFPNHEANPLEPANLVDLQRAVVGHGADLGLAFDGDADRCFVVDELGQPVGPSAVAAIVARREIERVRGIQPDGDIVVLHNLITSRIVPETIEHAGGVAVRTRVGHSYIKDEMAATGAIFGGEHSAHYYFRDFWGADNGMLAAMHLLAEFGSQDAPLSSLGATYTPYALSGEINSTVDDVPAAYARIVEEYTGSATFDELDGLTVLGTVAQDAPWWWFSVRPSNTEPLLRLNVEAETPEVMERVRDRVLALIREA
jgi:phosphomannomutase